LGRGLKPRPNFLAQVHGIKTMTRPARTCRARSPKLALVSLAALQPVGADYCELLDVLAQHVEELAEVLVRQVINSETMGLGQRRGQHHPK
jgi:hypothetical protein